jgi:hypothetical protein
MKAFIAQLILLLDLTQAGFCSDKTNSLELLSSFTVTPAYRESVLMAMLAEANAYARSLNLPENLPITTNSLAGVFICSPYVANRFGALGNLHTTNYSYAFGRGRHLSTITRLPKDKSGRNPHEKFKPWSIKASEVNTNAAYKLATQFLANAFVDLLSLSNSSVTVRPVTILNMTTSVYRIEWHQNKKTLVEVGLAEPNKELWKLHVEDAQYILRPPIPLPVPVGDKGTNQIISPPRQ